MRRCSVKAMRRAQLRGVLWLLAASLLAGGLWLDRYVNTVIKPTLHELAEYEARAATVQAVNRAVAAALAADASVWTQQPPGPRSCALSAPCRRK